MKVNLMNNKVNNYVFIIPEGGEKKEQYGKFKGKY